MVVPVPDFSFIVGRDTRACKTDRKHRSSSSGSAWKVVLVATHVTTPSPAALSRYQSERPRDPVHPDIIRKIAETVSIPVIAKYVVTCSDNLTSVCFNLIS